MKRVQLFEFEDFNWFPSIIRSSMTNLIVVLIKMMGIHEIIAKRIKSLLEKHPISKVVDLGSGSGGAMPLISNQFANDGGVKDVEFLLTDLYPNKKIVEKINSNSNDKLSYLAESTDATHFDSIPGGLKTMLNCFHHMPPEKAREILESAYRNKQPFLIYEMGENKMPLIIWLLLLPISLPIMMIMVWFMTPFVVGLTWQQLVLTYLIPIVPFCYAWDGQASMPRMYSMDDMDVLLEGLSSEDYSWVKEPAKNEKGKQIGTFVIGMPN